MPLYNRIILIDDDDISNFLLADILFDMKIANEIKCFPDGEAAIAYLETIAGISTASRDLILLDINMPILNGEEFLKIFRALPYLNKDLTKIIVLSAFVPSVRYEYLRTIGVEDFIEKPFTPEKLRLLLDRINRS